MVNQPFEVVCVGESMALVTPDPPGPLARGGPARLDVAGAESTVASYLAQLGVRAAWVGRIGADPLGELVRDRIAGYGVDVSMVTVEPSVPTGVFFKDPGPATAVYYYRRGSAASRLGPDVVDMAGFAGCGLVHLTGITPALSDSCAALVDRALSAGSGSRAGPAGAVSAGSGGGPAGALSAGSAPAGAVSAGGGFRCSFDVNYRPALWPPERAGPVLAGLAERAGIVFVGLDEAALLWGTGSPEAVRALLPGPDALVVKDGATGATSFTRDGITFVPACPVEVVEPVGAGDAFAAGYLCGVLRGLPETARLRLGHLVAGTALSVPGDVGPLPATGDLLARAMTGG